MDDKTRADVVDYLMTGGIGEMLYAARVAERFAQEHVSISTETAIVMLEMLFEEAKRRAH